MRRSLTALALSAALLIGQGSPAPASQGSGCLPTTGTVSGLSFSQLITQAIGALISSNSGASAPATDCTAAPVKGQFWLDTSVSPNVMKQYDGTAWVVLGALDGTNHLWAPPVGGGTAIVAAAPTTDICASPASVQTITGTTAISSFGSSCVAGVRKTLMFSSATSLTYNAASLILPGAASYTVSPGDVAEAVYLGGASWRVLNISKADGTAVSNPSLPIGTVIYGDWATIPPKTVYGNGQGVLRSQFPEYFAAVSRVQNGTRTNGSPTISGLADTSKFGIGHPVEGVGIPTGAVIASVTPTSITMSGNATSSGSGSVTVILTGYGLGGNNTTVGIKDCRGNVIAGRDDMGGTAANRLTYAASGVPGTIANGQGGAQAVTIQQPQLPNVAPTFTGINDPITVTSTSSNIGAGSSSLTTPGGNFPFNGVNGFFQISSTGQFTPRGNVGSINGGVTQASLPNAPPTVIAECVVVVSP